MTPEQILSLIAVVLGPASAALGYVLNRRAQQAETVSREADTSIKLSAAADAIEDRLWQRTKEDLESAYERIDKLTMDVRQERTKRRELESDLSDERVKRRELERKLDTETEKRQALDVELHDLLEEREAERISYEAMIAELKAEIKELRLRLNDTGPLAGQKRPS